MCCHLSHQGHPTALTFAHTTWTATPPLISALSRVLFVCDVFVCGHLHLTLMTVFCVSVCVGGCVILFSLTQLGFVLELYAFNSQGTRCVQVYLGVGYMLCKCPFMLVCLHYYSPRALQAHTIYLHAVVWTVYTPHD